MLWERKPQIDRWGNRRAFVIWSGIIMPLTSTEGGIGSFFETGCYYDILVRRFTVFAWSPACCGSLLIMETRNFIYQSRTIFLQKLRVWGIWLHCPIGGNNCNIVYYPKCIKWAIIVQLFPLLATRLCSSRPTASTIISISAFILQFMVSYIRFL